MGKRDIGHRETKKTKKDIKKSVSTDSFATPPPVVEVIKRGKKIQPEDEE
jgi:hypothetical protein